MSRMTMELAVRGISTKCFGTYDDKEAAMIVLFHPTFKYLIPRKSLKIKNPNTNHTLVGIVPKIQIFELQIGVRTRLPVTRWVTNTLQYQYNTNDFYEKERECV